MVTVLQVEGAARVACRYQFATCDWDGYLHGNTLAFHRCKSDVMPDQPSRTLSSASMCSISTCSEAVTQTDVFE